MPSYMLLLARDPDHRNNPLDCYAPDERRAVLLAHEYGFSRAMELWRDDSLVPLSLPANDRHWAR
jgi:hypothetical protein